MKHVLFIGLILFQFGVKKFSAQEDTYIDSVFKELDKTDIDSSRVNLLNTIASHYQNFDLKKVELYADSALKIAMAVDYPNGKVKAYFNLGNANYIKGDYSKTLDYYTKALKVLEDVGDKKGEASALMGIGNVHGVIGDYQKAIDYQKQSLEIRVELNDSLGIAGNYNNLGSIYTEMLELDTALIYHFKSLEIKEKMSYRKGLSSSYGNIGGIYNKQGKYEEALAFQSKALEIRKELNNLKGMVMSYTDIGGIHLSLGEFELALKNQNKGLQIAKEIGYGKGVVNALLSISSTYEKQGENGRALEFYKNYKVTQDSLFNLDKAAEMARIESQYESEKQELEIANLNKEKKINAIVLEQEKRKGYLMYSGLIAALIVAFLILIALINKRKANKRIQAQKKEVESAKEIIEEKQEEILDSIYYAKHIQKAILPSQKFIEENLSNSFVLYRPKAIVAGDFYWMEIIEDKIIFSAADCTGHGVPGAIVSVVCHNALNRAVREFGIIDPGKILEKTNELVEETFARSEEKVRDGMDIALCVIDKKNNNIQYAGAKNPLWIIRNGGDEVEEILATPRPIGFYDAKVEYNTNTIDYNSGDSIYMFSDGFQDQFGGNKGKKYKQKKFKDFLLKNCTKSSKEQKLLLNSEFESWKGDIEQIDDICVVGILL